MTLQNYLSVLLPELILMFAGGAVLFMAMSRRSAVRGAVAPLALLSLVVAAVVTVQRDDYDAVSGLAVGSLSHYVRLITTLVGSVLILVNWHQAEEGERGEYLALCLLSMAGVMLVASSSDLIVLFFALELVSVPTYVLVALSRRTHLVRASPSPALMETVRTSCLDPSASAIIEPSAVKRSMIDRTRSAGLAGLPSGSNSSLPYESGGGRTPVAVLRMAAKLRPRVILPRPVSEHAVRAAQRPRPAASTACWAASASAELRRTQPETCTPKRRRSAETRGLVRILLELAQSREEPIDANDLPCEASAAVERHHRRVRLRSWRRRGDRSG